MSKSALFIALIFIAFFPTGCKDDQPGENYPGDSTNKIQAITIDSLGKAHSVFDADPVVATDLPDSVQTLGSPDNTTSGTKIGGLQKPSRETDLKRKFKNLLVFHADDTMVVKTPRLATLILSRDATVEKMTLEVLDESNAADSSVKLDTTMDFGSKMKARLVQFSSSREDNSFEIEPLGEDVQSFQADRKKIIWQWKVTPLKPGQQELKLSLQVIEKDGEAVTLPARTIPIIIFAKKESFWSRAETFIENKYEFLFGIIIIPLLVAFIGGKIRNRQGAQGMREQKTKY